MKKLLLIIFSFFASITFAQNSNYKNIVTFSSFSLIGGRVDAGYIHQLNKNVWFGAEVGYGNGLLGFNNNLGSAKSSIFRFSPEIYYDLDSNSSWLHLLSIQYFYSKRMIEGFGGDVYNKGTYYRFTSADLDKTRQGININYSFLANREGKKLAIMPKIGFGVRYRNSKYSNFKDLHEDTPNVDDFTLGLLNNNAGSDFGFNVNFDLKLIYRF